MLGCSRSRAKNPGLLIQDTRDQDTPGEVGRGQGTRCPEETARGVAVPHGSPTAACPPEAGQHQSRLLSDLGKKQSTCAKNDLSNKQSIACYGEDGGGRLFCSSVMGESWTVTAGHNERLPAWSRIQGCVSSCPGPGARWWGPPRSLIPPVEPL